MVVVVRTSEQRSFTSIGPGTPAVVWRRHPAWNSGEPLSLESVGRLVVLAAHPDDEALGAGGLISTAARQGLPVDIVFATDGEHSHPGSPTRTPDEMAVRRAEEARRAAQALGVQPGHTHRLLLTDGCVADKQDALTSRLVEMVGDGRDTVIVAPWRHDGHPDHEAAGRAAAAAARRTGAELWEYPVWFWHWGNPDETPWTSLHRLLLSGGAVRDKVRAISCHVSQVAPLSELEGDETLMTPELLAHFGGPVEHYLRTASGDCPDDSLDELHRDRPDPWGADSRWYEQRKRDLVLAMLPKAEFARALEVGCSTGALAEALAARADRVLAVDRSVAALSAARRRFADNRRVSVADLDVPQEWAHGVGFDLIVVSEVGYFLSPVELDLLVDRIGASLTADGVLVLCHWRHRVAGWVMDAEQVHAGFEDPRLPPLGATYRDRDVEIRVHTRDDGWPDPLR